MKAWGNPLDSPVLAYHGISDNAGAFDRLVSHLPSAFYYLCIDLPGHGRSSCLPPYCILHADYYVLVYKMIADYFKRKRYVIIGHSMGAQIAILFAQLYPQYVSKLIMLDGIYLLPQPASTLKTFLSERLAQHQKLIDKLRISLAPTYTYEEAVERYRETRIFDGMSKEATEPVLQRMVLQRDYGKFEFTNDPRFRTYLTAHYGWDFAVEFLKAAPITCPQLLVLATETAPHFISFKNVLEELKKNKNCKVAEVEGSHDVHNVNPEIVGPIVSKFLLTNFSKL